MKRGTKRFVRYHRPDGCYVGLVLSGNKYDRMLVIDSFPIHVARVPINERKYYTDIDTLDRGIRCFELLKDRQPFTKAAAILLDRIKSN